MAVILLTYNPGDLGLMGDLLSNEIIVKTSPPERDSFLKQLFISIAPILLIIGILLYTMKGAGSTMGVKKPS